MCNADAYFALGKSHTVCQDYAAVKTVDGTVLAAVADGCSSSPDTDFGARFLVRTAVLDVTGLYDPKYLALGSEMAARALALDSHALDATLLVARTGKGSDSLELVAYGDGVFDVDFVDGTRSTYSIEFSSEAPAYLSYFLRPDDMEYYLNRGGNRKVTVEDFHPGMAPVVSTIEAKVTPEAFGFRMALVRANVRRVTLCSDGVRSFRKVTAQGSTEAIPLQNVLAEVNDIKSPAGAFMVRRMRRFLYDFCPKHGWYHDDDVGVATILNGA